MAETQVTFRQCDFCPNRAEVDSDGAKKFVKVVGDFDLCPVCNESSFGALTPGIIEAWMNMKRPGEGPYNGRVVELIHRACQVVLHEAVGSEATE